MKDYANPALLLIVIALLSWKVSLGIETPSSVEVWLLTLCATGFVVNGLLSIARALAHRRAVMSVVWSCVFLIFGSCGWVALRQEKDYRAEIAAFNELNTRWQHEQGNPFILADEEGRTLPELAAILGKKTALSNLLALPEAAQAQSVILRAALCAAENGRHEILTQLAQQRGGFDFNRMSEGRTPLVAAVLSDNRKSAEVLLNLNADPNLCDENGVSPLMHAVINNNPALARLLIERGADSSLKDSTGRDAASCSRSDLMDAILAPSHK